jgi:hypothetical protein
VAAIDVDLGSISLSSSSHFPDSKPSATNLEKACSLLLWGEFIVVATKKLQARTNRFDGSIVTIVGSFEVRNF